MQGQNLTEASGDIIFCPLVMRVGEDLLGAAELHQVPIEEEPGIVADPGSLLHGVGDDDDSVIFLQAAEKLFHLEGGHGKGRER